MSADDKHDGDSIAKDTRKPGGDVGRLVGVRNSGVLASKRQIRAEWVDLHEADSAYEQDYANDPVCDQEEVEPLLDALWFKFLHYAFFFLF